MNGSSPLHGSEGRETMEVEGILFSAQETCFFTYRGEDWMLTRLVRLFPLKLVDSDGG